MVEKRAHASTDAETGASMVPEARGERRLKRLVVNITPEDYQALEILVVHGKFLDLSDGVRAALRPFLAKALDRLFYEKGLIQGLLNQDASKAEERAS